MKLTKRLSALFAALLIAGTLFAAAIPAGAAAEDFVPVMRFTAASDSHVREDSDVTMQRIAKMMEIAYGMAEADPHYKNVDAAFIVGDLTNDGTTAEFDRFAAAVKDALRDGTRFLGVVAKNHDGYDMPHDEMRAYYTGVTGNDPDFHAVIGGYHFIGVSTSPAPLQHYDAKQLSWLRKQLDEAVADAPDRPVFVMHHEHVAGTVYGSSSFDRWGVSYFTGILKKYPQVVDFSGHSHFPLNDPRSVWQGPFTAIGTGAIYYSEFTVDLHRSYNPPDAYDTAAFWLVELNAAHDMRLRGIDILTGEPLCEYVLKNPADKANREFTPEKRAAASTAPVFPAGARLEASPVYGGADVRVPAAESTDGMPVVLYRIRAIDKHGMVVAKDWVLPRYYRSGAQNEIEMSVRDLAAGEYTIRVAAETAYGVQSEPLETAVSIDGDGAFASFFRRLGSWFTNLFTLIKSWF